MTPTATRSPPTPRSCSPKGASPRHAVRTGPITTATDPNGGSTFTFPSEFQFSPRVNSNGSFGQGLTGFTTTGTVTTTTAPDGSQAALIVEDSPSSLATVVTIPNADTPVLVMDLKWLGALDPHEVATFTVDFTDVNRVTTPLFQTGADNPLFHSDQLQNVVVPIPAGLRGEKGVIRFMLDPSSSDGIISQVMLGGFGDFGVPRAPLPRPQRRPCPAHWATTGGTSGRRPWRCRPRTTSPAWRPRSTASTAARGRLMPAPSPSRPTECIPVEFYSTDNAGNVEATNTQTIQVDQTPPATTATLSGLLGSHGWYVGPATVALSAADNLSGVATTQYRVNGGSWQTYAGPFPVSADGIHSVDFYSTDNAGNVEAIHTQVILVDQTDPDIDGCCQSVNTLATQRQDGSRHRLGQDYRQPLWR